MRAFTRCFVRASIYTGFLIGNIEKIRWTEQHRGHRNDSDGRVYGADNGTATHFRQRCRSIGIKRMTVQYGRFGDAKILSGNSGKSVAHKVLPRRNLRLFCPQSRSGWWNNVEPMCQRPMLQAFSAIARGKAISRRDRATGQTGNVDRATFYSRTKATAAGGALLAVRRLCDPLDLGI